MVSNWNVIEEIQVSSYDPGMLHNGLLLNSYLNFIFDGKLSKML